LEGCLPVTQLKPQDPFLTAQAVTARPIILAARQLIETYGRAPTEDELKAHLAQKSIQAQPPQGGWISPPLNGPFGAWLYFSKEKGFSLYLKLGWDPALLYEESAKDQGEWIFDPGDGSDEKKLDLKVGI
jgi:hypothetical protein